MPKILNEYTSGAITFTAQNIVDRSNIGVNTVVGNTVEVRKLKNSDIKALTSITSNKLSALYYASGYNKYSKFGVIILFAEPVFGKDYSKIVFNPPVNVRVLTGNFAGYNHEAVMPKITSSNVIEGSSHVVEVCQGEHAFFSPNFTIHLGEIDYNFLNNSVYAMRVIYANNDLSVTYAVSDLFVLNESTFFKTLDDAQADGSVTFERTSNTLEHYSVYYKFYDNAGNELLITGEDERFKFTVIYKFLTYSLSGVQVDVNDYFDEVAYSGYEFIVNTNAQLTLYDFVVKLNGSCNSEKIQVYIHYFDITDEAVWWEAYHSLDGEDYNCNPTENMTIQLDKNRINCGEACKIKIWRDNILNRPDTRPL